MDQDKQKHPSYGMVQINKLQGSSGRLFGVDYPVHSSIRLSLLEGEVERRYGEQWFYGGKNIVEIEFSEVQWAAIVCGMNVGGGHPVTIRYQRDGALVKVDQPPEHMGSIETSKAEIASTCRKAVGGIDDAVKALGALLKGTGSIKKGDLQPILEQLRMAHQDVASNMPFQVEQATKSIDKAKQRAQTEIDAHLAFSIRKIGMDAIADRLTGGAEELEAQLQATIEGPVDA